LADRVVVDWRIQEYELVDDNEACHVDKVKSSQSYEASPYGITQCYLPPDTSELAPPNPILRDGRLSRPRWLVTYRDGLPAHGRSPIQVLTGPGVD